MSYEFKTCDDNNPVDSSKAVNSSISNINQPHSSSSAREAFFHQRYSNVKPGFIRLKLIELEPPPDSLLQPQSKNYYLEPVEPYCEVNIKELIKLESRRKKNKRSPILASYNSFSNTVSLIDANNGMMRI